MADVLDHRGPELALEQLGAVQPGVVGGRVVAVGVRIGVGAGGLGAPLAMYLAAAGVGTIGIVDFDVVDESNLQRQIIHGTSDVGRPKLESARDRIKDINPNVNVEVFGEPLSSDNALDIFKDFDIIVDGTDNFPTRYAVSDAATALGLPAVWAAVLRFDAQISSFVPGRPGSVSLRDLYPTPPRPEDVPSCSEAGVLGALLGQVGSIMAGEAVKLICGFGEPLVGRLLLVDALTQRTREVPLRPAGAVLPPRPQPEPTRELVPLEEVSAEEVSAAVAAPGGPVLLDVREPAEHALGTVPGALTVPVGEVLTWEELVGQLPEGPVVVYCKTGPRARRAAAHLVKIGHPEVRVMTGGMLAWIERVDPSLPPY